MRIAKAVMIAMLIVGAATLGYQVMMIWHDRGVSNNVLLDQQTRAAQDNLKRTKAFLELEVRKRVKAEATAKFYQSQAARFRQAADDRAAARQRDLTERPAPSAPAEAAIYWEGKYRDSQAENQDLRTAFSEQMKVSAMFQELYISAQRDIAKIGDASTSVSTALEAEHGARQCKVLGLVSCPSRGAMFAAGVITTVLVKTVAHL